MKEKIIEMVDEAQQEINSGQITVERAGSKVLFNVKPDSFAVPEGEEETIAKVLDTIFETTDASEGRELTVYLPGEIEARKEPIEGDVMIKDTTTVVSENGHTFLKGVISYQEGDFDEYVATMNAVREEIDEYAIFDGEDYEAWLVSHEKLGEIVTHLEENGFEVGKTSRYRAKEEMFGKEVELEDTSGEKEKAAA